MSWAAVALVACFVMLAIAVIDGVRGVSALGPHRLTKKGTPDKFWLAIVLYVNMAFAMLWLAGQVTSPDEPGQVTVRMPQDAL
ncbi:hypothetical protein [Aurantiacibacter spongiae]|uniref:Uncharacterized protein n=1 Tax=Aurantiacibacter spongiae TaxID=2488860 RepID=A0A3N5DMU6_9SPHN|nr:hypothetical protein [Aurantiacibacter spongiae]RPF72225.1 hypothetical protein EG799_11770 [Aurantiacibacter spongiae]